MQSIDEVLKDMEKFLAKERYTIIKNFKAKHPLFKERSLTFVRGQLLVDNKPCRHTFNVLGDEPLEKLYQLERKLSFEIDYD